MSAPRTSIRGQATPTSTLLGLVVPGAGWWKLAVAGTGKLKRPWYQDTDTPVYWYQSVVMASPRARPVFNPVSRSTLGSASWAVMGPVSKVSSVLST